MVLRLKGRAVCRGKGEGRAIVTREAVSFLGSIDPESGVVVEEGHELFGRSIAGKVLVFPGGKGSTVGSFVLYQLGRNGVAPVGMVAVAAEPIVAVGAILARIPLVDSLEPFGLIETGQQVRVDGDAGIVEVLENQVSKLKNDEERKPKPVDGKYRVERENESSALHLRRGVW